MIALSEDAKIDAFVANLEKSSELRIPYSQFPSAELVMQALKTPLSSEALHSAYRAMHARAIEGFSRFIAALEKL